MVRVTGLVLVLTFAAILSAACGSSGEASEPIQIPANPTTEAGSSAISAAVIDADNCAGVLSPIEGDLTLYRDSLTSTVSTSQPQIETMCSATYDTGLVDREFLAVVLIQFDSDDSAVDHYELMKVAYTEADGGVSEVNNADENLTDTLSSLVDQNGIGRTTVMRQREWLVTVTAGPTMAQSLWNVGDIESIGRSVLDRAQQ